MNKASERSRMSQSHEMCARLTQAQAAQAYRSDLELAPHEVIQAHPLRQQIPPRLSGRKLIPALLLVCLQHLGLDQGHVAPTGAVGKGPNTRCITISLQAPSCERADPFHRLRYVRRLGRHINA